MVIKGARTIAEYRQIQAEKIQNWIDSNFVEGSVTWKMDGANAVKVTDRTGDSMVMSEKQTSGSCLMITQITTNRPV